MLVISRQKHESITIGPFQAVVDGVLTDTEIDICVADIRGDKVRLGVTAGKSIPVNRKEVADAIKLTGLSQDEAVAQYKQRRGGLDASKGAGA